MNEREIREYFNKLMLGIYSIITIITFQLKLDLVDVEDSTLLSCILNFTQSFNQYNIIYILLIPAIYYFYQYTSRKHTGKNTKLYSLAPAALFSFFMCMGYSYDQLGNWDLVINKNIFQCLKVLIAFSGYTIFFYYCISFVFYTIDVCNISSRHERNKKNIILKYFECLKNKPILTSFITLLLFYIPYIIMSYPAIFGYDMVSQITSSYAELGIYSPQYTGRLANYEGLYLNNHHPIVHTLFIHGCLEIGKRFFSSYNIGIFICALSQLLFILVIVSILIKLLIELEISEKYIFGVLLYYALSPRIQSYIFFITKDIIYSAFALLFIICLFQIVRGYAKKKHYIVFGVAILGILLFRNDGRYLLLLTFIGIAILCKKIRKKMLICAVSVIIFSAIYSNIILPTLHIIPGSIKEVLSVPFQQTARYLKYSSDPITQEEKEAISAILDYDSIVENYNPETSDNVKNTYNVLATKEELKEYFRIYIQMFFKHPSHYIQATMNNYYYFFYPGPRLASYYSYNFSASIMDVANDSFSALGTSFEYPKAFNKWRNIYEQLREGIVKLPIISLLASSATYNWILILLVFYGIKEKNRKSMAMTVPLCVQLLISLAGPCNGWYFRYVYPIAICLPAVILMSICLVKSEDVKSEKTEEHKQ